MDSSFNNGIMDFNEFDLSSETMNSFLEMEQVPEVIEPKVMVTKKTQQVIRPSIINSDMELEKNQELIEELEEFFMKTEGKPTVVEETETINTGLSLQELQGAVTTNMITEDGQNVIIIIAPSSPSESQDIAALSPVPRSEGESDPEWSPYPHSDSPLQSPPAPPGNSTL